MIKAFSSLKFRNQYIDSKRIDGVQEKEVKAAELCN